MLFNNVGLVLGERRVTPDGSEHVFAPNHLAPFLLTSLLLPKLAASAATNAALGRSLIRPCVAALRHGQRG